MDQLVKFGVLTFETARWNASPTLASTASELLIAWKLTWGRWQWSPVSSITSLFSQPFQLWRTLWHVWPLGIRQYSTIFNIMSHRIHVWYTNIRGILMVNVTIYSIHGSNGCLVMFCSTLTEISVNWRGGTSSVYLVRNPTLEEQFVKANRRSTECNFLVTQGWRPVQKKHNIA